MDLKIIINSIIILFGLKLLLSNIEYHKVIGIDNGEFKNNEYKLENFDNLSDVPSEFKSDGMSDYLSEYTTMESESEALTDCERSNSLMKKLSTYVRKTHQINNDYSRKNIKTNIKPILKMNNNNRPEIPVEYNQYNNNFNQPNFESNVLQVSKFYKHDIPHQTAVPSNVKNYLEPFDNSNFNNNNYVSANNINNYNKNISNGRLPVEIPVKKTQQVYNELLDNNQKKLYNDLINTHNSGIFDVDNKLPSFYNKNHSQPQPQHQSQTNNTGIHMDTWMPKELQQWEIKRQQQNNEHFQNQVDMSRKCMTSNQPNLINVAPPHWDYKNDLGMNGGTLFNNVKGFDQYDTNFAAFSVVNHNMNSNVAIRPSDTIRKTVDMSDNLNFSNNHYPVDLRKPDVFH